MNDDIQNNNNELEINELNAKTMISLIEKIDTMSDDELYNFLLDYIIKLECLAKSTNINDLRKFITNINNSLKYKSEIFKSLRYFYFGYFVKMQEDIINNISEARYNEDMYNIVSSNTCKKIVQYLYDYDDLVNLSLLAKELKMDSANLSKIIKPLIVARIVNRVSLNRRTFYKLTDYGKTYWEQINTER